MPIYEYRCSKCQHKLEALQKFSDAPLTTCPACGESALTKLVSAAGFQLKGSGWYQTDFRSSGSAKPAEKKEGQAERDKPASTDVPAKTETSTTKTDAPAATPAATSSPTPSSTS
jgi:putative FmdB family regulatory protein